MFKTTSRSTLLIASATAVAAFVLTACDQPDKTVGQRTDNAGTNAGQRADQAIERVGDKVVGATDKAAVLMEDTAITAGVKAELAKDPGLSALRIHVATTKGAVLLTGEAPNKDARERAARLAAAVRGVQRVDNKLVVNG